MITVFRESDDAMATYLDGAHRYFAVLSVGYPTIPCHLHERPFIDIQKVS